MVNSGSSWVKSFTSNATNFSKSGSAATPPKKCPAVKSITDACVAMKALSEPRWPSPAKMPPGKFAVAQKIHGQRRVEFCRSILGSILSTALRAKRKSPRPCNLCCADHLSVPPFQNGLGRRWNRLPARARSSPPAFFRRRRIFRPRGCRRARWSRQKLLRRAKFSAIRRDYAHVAKFRARRSPPACRLSFGNWDGAPLTVTETPARFMPETTPAMPAHDSEMNGIPPSGSHISTTRLG